MMTIRSMGLGVLATAAMVLAGCATKPKHSYPAGVDPAAESKNLSQEMRELQAQQLDVLSPVHYQNANRAITRADRQINKDGDRTGILNDLQIARDEISKTKESGEKWRGELKEAADAREKALQAGAVKSYPRELATMDEKLKDMTEETKIKSGTYRDDSLKLQKDYMAIELKAIQRRELGQSRRLIEEARDAGAKRYAPQSLSKAETDLQSAERQIEANRNEPGQYAEAVTTAKNSARALLSVTLTAKEARNKSPEEIALAIRAKEAAIAEQEKRAMSLENMTEAQQAELAAKDQELESETQRMNQQLTAAQAANLKLEKENAFNEKLKEIESQFSKNEADVYRQGDSLVVRLKSVQFSASRSDLPAKSLPTLAKVNNVIKELGAEKVVVEGHTDSVGSKDVNQKISQERAQAVSQYLVSQSAAASDKVEAVGYGFEKPITSNKTKEGRAQNRRVDIVITPASIE
ncbi:MAG: OmpA family protein [Bdellovibrionaceae bacterium]|nr:OmpA family protein [Pseudobdellovibrionaceae bacterium]